MAHNQKMLEKNKENWKGKVRIIGVSKDNAVEKVNKHVQKKKWKLIEHYLCAGSSCSQDYGIIGIPNVMLIDKNGVIVFKGHPSTRKLENDIETLLRDEIITGEGTVHRS